LSQAGRADEARRGRLILLLGASAMTGANGSASYTVKLKRTDPAGSYGVAAVATSGDSSTSGATTFAVQ
jgi:hypothetical protein